MKVMNRFFVLKSLCVSTVLFQSAGNAPVLFIVLPYAEFAATSREPTGYLPAAVYACLFDIYCRCHILYICFMDMAKRQLNVCTFQTYGGGEQVFQVIKRIKNI